MTAVQPKTATEPEIESTAEILVPTMNPTPMSMGEALGVAPSKPPAYSTRP